MVPVTDAEVIPIVLAAHMGEVPREWWDVLLDGHLWRVDVAEFPFPVSCVTLREALRARAKRQGLRTSVRMEGYLGQFLHVQAYPSGVNGFDVRLPLTDAFPAPRVPPIPRVFPDLPVQLRKPEWTEIAERLVAAQNGLPDMPPWELRKHSVLYWVADQCDCGTGNWRTHTSGCFVYPMLPMLEKQVARLKLVPEEWLKAKDGVLYRDA